MTTAAPAAATKAARAANDHRRTHDGAPAVRGRDRADRRTRVTHGRPRAADGRPRRPAPPDDGDDPRPHRRPRAEASHDGPPRPGAPCPPPRGRPHGKARAPQVKEAATAKRPRRGMHSPSMPVSKPPCVATARSWPTAPAGDGRTQCDSLVCSTRPGRVPPVAAEPERLPVVMERTTALVPVLAVCCSCREQFPTRDLGRIVGLRPASAFRFRVPAGRRRMAQRLQRHAPRPAVLRQKQPFPAQKRAALRLA